MRVGLRRTLIGLGGFVVLAAVAILTLPFWLPKGPVERALTQAVRQGIGRDLVIHGPFQVGLFPVRLEADDAALVQQRQGDAPPFITAAKLTAVLSLPRLFRGVFTITRLTLDDPVVLFSVDGQGRPNWTEEAGVGAVAKPAPGPATAEEARQRAAQKQGFSLADIDVSNGVVRYEDVRSKVKSEIDALGLHASLPGLDKPLTADGSFTWRGRPVRMSASLANPGQLGGDGESGGHLDLSADAGHATFDGTVAGQGETLAHGDLSVEIPSIQQFAAWAGATLSLPGAGKLTLKGKGTLSQDKYALADATLVLDQIKGTGSLTTALGSARPSVEGTLALGAVDLTPYVDAAPAAAKPVATGGRSLDPGALPNIDVRLALSADSVKLPALALGHTAASVTLTGNTLVIDRIEVPFDGGRVSGRISLTEAGGDSLAWDAALLAQRLQLARLFADKVTGIASAELRVGARGRTQQEILDSLSGNARVSTVNTQVRGLHLPALIGNVPGAVIAAASGRDIPAERATVQATFQLTAGTARTEDLDIKSEAVRMTGTGTIDLTRQRIDVLLTPRILSPSAVSLIGIRLSGFMSPILVQGPWNAPSYTPQTGRALKQHLGDPMQSLKDIAPAQLATPAAPATKDSGFDPIGWLDRQFSSGSK